MEKNKRYSPSEVYILDYLRMVIFMSINVNGKMIESFKSCMKEKGLDTFDSLKPNDAWIKCFGFTLPNLVSN
jgi:hypothetical protein